MDIFWNVRTINYYEIFYQSGIQKNANFDKAHALVKNLSYNTQYLEFLSNAIKEKIHGSIRMEFIKTFVITSMSIIESILYYFVTSHGFKKFIEFEEFTKICSIEKKIDNSILKIETKVMLKIKFPKEDKIEFSYMIKTAKENKLLGVDKLIYKKLEDLQVLRNRIHLYLILEKLDHDWNNFNNEALNLMKDSMIAIIYSKRFKLKNSEKDVLFGFLK